MNGRPPIDKWFVATLRLLRIRPLETGVWCRRCALPSAVRFELLVRLDNAQPYYMSEIRCLDCTRAVTDG